MENQTNPPGPSLTPTGDSFEESITLPPQLRKGQDEAFIQAARTFNGKKLFPYAEGTRLLLASLTNGSISNDHWLLLLLYILIQLQERYEVYTAAKMSEDDATVAAVSDVLEEIEGPEPEPGQVKVNGASRYRAKVLLWATKLPYCFEEREVGPEGKKVKRRVKVSDSEKGIALALEVYNEANKSELIPADAKEGEPPK